MQTIRNAGTEVFDDTISGVIHLALSLNMLGVMSEFRAAITRVVMNRCVVKVGQPSMESEVRRRLVLKWFVPKVPNARVIRALMELSPNGDWSSDEVEVWAPLGIEHNADAIKARTARGITQALEYKRWDIYLRNK